MTGTTTRAKPIATFSPLAWQVQPWRDRSFVLLLTGSAGGGKSKLAAEKVHAFCLKYTGATGLVLRKARESATNSTVLFLERKVIAGDQRVRHVPSKLRFEYANGSVLAYGGMYDDKQREQIRSIGQDGSVDIAWLEEATAFAEDDYNEILGRMRGRAAPWRQVILTTNPDAPTHWIYRRLIEQGEAHVYYSAASDNSYNPPEYIDTLATLTGPLGDRLARGLWVQAEGAVYADWHPAVHVLDSLTIPDDWRRLRVIDFGYTNPFVCQWWAVDGDGRMYLYRELYMSHRLVAEHAERIKALSAGERIEATICDHDAEDRATLAAAGIPNVAARKDVKAGLQVVASRLRTQGDGRPRLYVLRDALIERDDSLPKGAPACTMHEFPGYSWPKAQDGRAIKEEPVKVNDHGMDAVRYACMYVDVGALPAPVPGVDPFAVLDRSPAGPAVELRRDEQGRLQFVRPMRRQTSAAAALKFGRG